MEIRIGTLPVPGLPLEIPVGNEKKLSLERSAQEEVLLLSNVTQNLSLEVPDLVRDLVWCTNFEEEVLVLSSHYGQHAYLIDSSTLQVRSDLVLFRDQDHTRTRLGILVTPDGTRILVVSDWFAHLLSWQGEVLFEQRISPYDPVAKIDNQTLTIWENGTASYRTYSLPSSPKPSAEPAHIQQLLFATLSAEGRSLREKSAEGNEAKPLLEVVSRLPRPGEAIKRWAAKGTPLAEFYFHTQAGDFPCQGWDGEPLLSFASFLTGTASLVRRPPADRKWETEPLLTGPYYIEIRVSPEQMATFLFLRSYVTGPIEQLPPVTVPFGEYRRMLLDRAETLLEDCRKTDLGDEFERQQLDISIGRLRDSLS